MTSDALPEPTSNSAPGRKSFRDDRLWAWAIAAVVVLLSLVPYLIGWSFAGDRVYMGLGYNIDDSCVYLSWMRQAHDGSLRAYNLFTTDPQHGMAMNPFFAMLGLFARFTGLPLIVVYHLSRLVCGFGMLLLVWEFIVHTVRDLQARRFAFLCVCFGSGLGWLPLWWDTPGLNTPIDKWQPEAITFLSLYLSPLFCFSLALQVGVLLLLFHAERTGRMKYAVYAGLLGFVLGLTHSYDIISLSVVWLGYRLVSLFARPATSTPEGQRKSVAWLQALVAGAITIPAVLYVFKQYRSEAVFRARADVQTLSSAPGWILTGYGLLVVFGLFAVYRLLRPTPEKTDDPTSSTLTASSDATRLLLVWAFGNVVVSYLPFAFQRKMLQGAHFPIAILTGLGFACLLASSRWKNGRTSAFAALALVVLVFPTNLRFVLRDLDNDVNNRSQTYQQRPYLQPGEVEAMRWIAANVPANEAVQPLPWIARVEANGRTQIGVIDSTVACFTPGYTNRHVYVGHWGETPDFGKRLNAVVRLGRADLSDADRLSLLREMKVRYLVFTQKSPGDSSAEALMPVFRGLAPLPPYLTRVYSNPDADIYRVDISP